MSKEGFASKMQAVFEGWVIGWPAYLFGGACVILFAAGVPELLELLFGRPPRSIAGLWAVVATVTVAGKVANNITSDSHRLRLWNHGSLPAHLPSIFASVAVGLSVLATSWEGAFGSQSFIQAASAGLAVGLLAYLTVGRVWRATWLDEWTRKNAHVRRVKRYIVEGRNGAGASWTVVSRLDDVSGLQEARSKAHAEFQEVRYWCIESDVTLMQSGAVPNLMFATPADAVDIPEIEARQRTPG